MPSDLRCAVCGGTTFTSHAVLWDALAEEWGLSAAERSLVDRQQGCLCDACGANLRSMALAAAILDALGTEAALQAVVDAPAVADIALLEVNEAGMLSPTLRRLPGYVFGGFPEVDMLAMPYPDGCFDLVAHSDTLEHVSDPLRALEECRRVLRPGGALCFTVPMLPNRISRSRAGLPPSYHGTPATRSEDYRVHTEFGADTWTWVLRAGFHAVTVTPAEHPAALAFTGWRGLPAPLLQPARVPATAGADRAALEAARAELAAMRASTSWRLTAGLRAVVRALRGA